MNTSDVWILLVYHSHDMNLSALCLRVAESSNLQGSEVGVEAFPEGVLRQEEAHHTDYRST